MCEDHNISLKNNISRNDEVLDILHKEIKK